ncbi:MAG: hypothetical protein WAO56_01725 [Miniphocaeibacter sp.]|uniref:PGN_0703 family putative restriction endonuclease n=1 Tax=Miniphocaeibacter sp. TaxID=3100973 RepID=UPI003BAF938F
MKYDEFKKRVTKHLGKYMEKNLGIKEDGLFKNKEYGHVLSDELVAENFIGETYPLYEKYCPNKELPVYSNHLNSSQVMGMNFFLPLLENRDILNRVVEKIIGKEEGTLTDLVTVDFEHRCGQDEKTEIDLFLEYANGIRIFFEMKYSENGYGIFSGFNRDEVWDNKYSNFIANSLYLKNLTKEEFFYDYQINRNIGMINSLKDYAVFILPYDNESLIKEITKFNYNNVKTVDWNYLAYYVYNLVVGKNRELENHYREFILKYLEY